MFFQETLMTNRGWVAYCVSFLQLLQLLYQLVLPFRSYQKRQQENIRFPLPYSIAQCRGHSSDLVRCWHTTNSNFWVNWLTKYIHVTCTDRTIANSIPCMALINPRMTAMYIKQNKMIIAAKNSSCILPYPCDVRKRVTSSLTLKIYGTALNYWAWTM